jgi:hypothetical protein
MKTLLHQLGFGIFITALLISSHNATAQIDYLQNYGTNNPDWSTADFETTDVAVCGTDMAFRAHLVNEAGTTVPVETVSQSIGVSNGEITTLSYTYKLLDYDAVLPYTAVDDSDWGVVTLAYGPTRNGPWTELDVINPINHEPSTDCMARTVTFTPQADSEVYLKFLADAGPTPGLNYFVYLDDVSVYQETLSIAPITGRDAIEAYVNPVTDYLNIDYDGYITDVALFDMQGQPVEIEDVDSNLTRLDMSGMARGNYVLKVTADNQVTTLNILKK